MWKHKVLEHPDEEVTFTMKVIKKHHSSFQRMVMEAIVIGETQQQGHNILNSKSGFNRCLILARPKLTCKSKIERPLLSKVFQYIL